MIPMSVLLKPNCNAQLAPRLVYPFLSHISFCGWVPLYGCRGHCTGSVRPARFSQFGRQCPAWQHVLPVWGTCGRDRSVDWGPVSATAHSPLGPCADPDWPQSTDHCAEIAEGSRRKSDVSITWRYARTIGVELLTPVQAATSHINWSVSGTKLGNMPLTALTAQSAAASHSSPIGERDLPIVNNHIKGNCMFVNHGRIFQEPRRLHSKTLIWHSTSDFFLVGAEKRGSISVDLVDRPRHLLVDHILF